jgi:UDP-N-acetylmuramoyl-tripeptide--D-alanyl-D-alanine ligase
MRYSKDTRSIQAGDYYVAIKGENFDGHAFVRDALAKGAAKVVIEQDLGQDVDVPAESVIRVSNTLQYLIEQAQEKIRQFQPKIVGITGSVGKTSTRKAVVHVLKASFKVVEPEGNLNTPLGLALTILNGLDAPETVLVLEMGARFVGDIDELCGYFRPDIGVVTNVHGVHLETFGSLENIAHEKGMIVEHLTSSGIACLNADNELVRAMSSRNKGRTILYSANNADTEAEIHADLIPKPYSILGGHAIYTILAAYSVGYALGMEKAQMLAQIATLTSEKGRLSKLNGRNGSILIDDTYNASPAATLSALNVLKNIESKRKIAFLGDMLELGEDESSAHQQVAQAALESAHEVFFVGQRMKTAIELLGIATKVHWFATSTEVAEHLHQPNFLKLTTDDAILVKGSQGIRMERISEALLDPSVDPSSVLVRQETSWKGK